MVDTVGNLESRVFGCLLMMQARILIKYIGRYAEDESVLAYIPATEGLVWLSRWRREWGVCTMSVNLVCQSSTSMVPLSLL